MLIQLSSIGDSKLCILSPLNQRVLERSTSLSIHRLGVALAEQIHSMVRPTRCSPSPARTGSMTMGSETIHSTVRSPERLIQFLSSFFVAWTSDSSDRLILGYTTSTSFQVRMPIADAQSALLHLVVRVRDGLGCTTEQNVSSISVITNTSSILTSIATIQAALANSAEYNTRPSDLSVRTLYGGNQIAVCRLLTSLAQAFNLMAKQSLLLLFTFILHILMTSKQSLLVATASKSEIIDHSRAISPSLQTTFRRRVW